MSVEIFSSASVHFDPCVAVVILLLTEGCKATQKVKKGCHKVSVLQHD